MMPGRKPTRRSGYDYSLPGSYFVTICTKDRCCIMATIQDDQSVLSEIGKAVELQWLSIPRHFPSIRVDEYVIMPNHLHGILLLYPLNSLPDNEPGFRFPEMVGAGQAPQMSDRGMTDSRATRPLTHPVTLFEVVGFFKSEATKAANRLKSASGGTIWQRSFNDRMLINHEAYLQARRYIADNPAQWTADREYVPAG